MRYQISWDIKISRDIWYFFLKKIFAELFFAQQKFDIRVLEFRKVSINFHYPLCSQSNEATLFANLSGTGWGEIGDSRMFSRFVLTRRLGRLEKTWDKTTWGSKECKRMVTPTYPDWNLIFFTLLSLWETASVRQLRVKRTNTHRMYELFTQSFNWEKISFHNPNTNMTICLVLVLILIKTSQAFILIVWYTSVLSLGVISL